MAILRNASDHPIYVGWGRRNMVWLEPDETCDIDDDAVENYTLPGLEALYEVTPSVPSPSAIPAPPAPPVTTSQEKSA